LSVVGSETGIKNLSKCRSLTDYAEGVEEWLEKASYVIPELNRLILQRLDERLCSECQKETFELT